MADVVSLVLQKMFFSGDGGGVRPVSLRKLCRDSSYLVSPRWLSTATFRGILRQTTGSCMISATGSPKVLLPSGFEYQLQTSLTRHLGALKGTELT